MEGIGALIGLFTRGLAIKKLLVSLSHYQLNAIIVTRYKVIITICAERLKSSLISAQYKLVRAWEEVMDKLLLPLKLLLLFSVSPQWKKAIKRLRESVYSCTLVYITISAVHLNKAVVQ